MRKANLIVQLSIPLIRTLQVVHKERLKGIFRRSFESIINLNYECNYITLIRLDSFVFIHF